MEKVRFRRFNTLALYNRENNDRAKLDWSIRGFYPRITVYTGEDAFVDNKPNYDKIIIAPFSITTLGYLITNLELCNNTKEPTHNRIDCYNTKVVNGVRTDEKYIQASVEVGKDEEGVCYIKVSEENKRTIKFKLLPNTVWFKYYDKSGEQIKDNGVLSKIFTRGYIRTIRKLILDDSDNYNTTETLLDPPNVVKEDKTTTVKEEPKVEDKIEVKEDNNVNIDDLLGD